MKAITLGMTLVLLVGLTAAYGEDKKDDNKAKIVGIWEMIKGDLKGATIEFTKDGKFKVAYEDEGEKKMTEGTYSIDGESLKAIRKDPDGSDHKETLKITKLTEKDLVVETEDGKVTECKRVEKPKE
jgi:uncharacterized protein (TIGR03066 family)